LRNARLDQHELDGFVGVCARRREGPERRVLGRWAPNDHAHEAHAAHEPANQADRNVGKPAPQRLSLAQRTLFERSQ
jgi:hypothetical protein